jgi:hypothetical protein
MLLPIGHNTEPFKVGTSLEYKGRWVRVYMTEEQWFRSVMGNPDFERAMEADYRKQMDAQARESGYRDTNAWWKFWR